MAEFYNRAAMTTATTGTGTITLGSAVTGYATFAESGAQNADEVTYCIEDGDDFEIGTGTYTSAGTTLSRDTVTLSKIGGSAGTAKINLSGSAIVFIVGEASFFHNIGSDVQAWDTDLDAIAALAKIDGNVIVGNGSTWVAESGSTARTSLGLGTGDTPQLTGIELGHASDTTLTRASAGDVNIEGNIAYRAGGTDVPVTDGGTGSSTASGARTNLGVVIGSDVQAYDADLGAVAGLSSTGMIARTGAGTASVRTITGTSGEIDVTNGDGVSGNPTLALDSDQTTKTLTFIIDGGGSAITTGVKGYIEVPFACTITQATALADQSGSIVVDIWKDTYANYPPIDADSITASAPVTITTATKSQDSTLTGWTTSITAGDILGYNVDSATTVELVTISLEVTIP